MKFSGEIVMSSKTKQPFEFTPEFKKNSEFFKKNLEKWHEQVAYKHKHVVIANQKVEYVSDNFSAALEFATAKFVPGKFIIQQVIREDELIGFLKLAR